MSHPTSTPSLSGVSGGPSLSASITGHLPFSTLPLQQLTAPLTRVVLPTLSRIRDDALFLRYLVRAQLLNSYILVGALAIGASVAQPLIATTLGPQLVWRGAYFPGSRAGRRVPGPRVPLLLDFPGARHDRSRVALRRLWPSGYGRFPVCRCSLLGDRRRSGERLPGSALLLAPVHVVRGAQGRDTRRLDYRRHDSGPSALHRHLHGDAGRPADLSQHWTPAAGVSCRVGAARLPALRQGSSSCPR